jgi:hypothetical protein
VRLRVALDPHLPRRPVWTQLWRRGRSPHFSAQINNGVSVEESKDRRISCSLLGARSETRGSLRFYFIKGRPLRPLPVPSYLFIRVRDFCSDLVNCIYTPTLPNLHFSPLLSFEYFTRVPLIVSFSIKHERKIIY